MSSLIALWRNCVMRNGAIEITINQAQAIHLPNDFDNSSG
jgi:hypothetical protein